MRGKATRPTPSNDSTLVQAKARLEIPDANAKVSPMAYTVIRGEEQVFQPPSWSPESLGRTLIDVPLHANLQYSQANLWRYPPRCRTRGRCSG